MSQTLPAKTYYEAVRILDNVGLRPDKTIQEASSDAPKGENRLTKSTGEL